MKQEIVLLQLSGTKGENDFTQLVFKTVNYNTTMIDLLSIISSHDSYQNSLKKYQS